MSNWPEPLKGYVKRVFELTDDYNRDQANDELRQIIFEAHKQNSINTTDWDNHPLPPCLAPPAPPASAPASKSVSKRKSLLSSPPTSSEEQTRRDKRARRFDSQQPANGPPPPLGLSSQQARSNPKKTRFGQGPSPPSFVPAQGFAPRPFGAQPMAFGGPIGSFANGSGAAPVTTAPSASPMALAPAVASPRGLEVDPNVIDWDEDTVVGTCTTLEKPYLRLTSAPDPRTVRPLPVLEKTLTLLKQKWRADHNYAYICDQFKSMRQDLTVQRIKNPFTVQVYEIHARFALEKGDLGEYNQCQSQLLILYELGIPGRVSEFTAYRILYLLHTRNRRDLNALLPELQRPADPRKGQSVFQKLKDDPAVAHALNVRRALLTGNYHAFFTLFTTAPNMNAYVMDHFIDRERTRALLTMAHTYRPSLSLEYVFEELAFSSTDEMSQFLTSIRADSYANPTKPASNGNSESANGGLAKRATKGKLPLWDTRAALPHLMSAAEKFKRVDIKGQV